MKGIYALVIEVTKSVEIKVGALGKLGFPKGTYVYVGSAQNSVESRVKRHLRKEKKLFWHIDYLLALPEANVTQVYYTSGDKNKECQIACLIGQKAIPINNFGCSDCNCNSHLFFIKNTQLSIKNMKKLENPKI